MNKSKYPLVFATDGSHKNVCQNCKMQPCKCRQALPVEPQNTLVKIRVEKKGRGGKSVTVLFNLPHNPGYFKKLLTNLKSHCGSGGTFKGDQVEIQGDHRNKIKEFLEKLKFNVKLAGG